MIILSNKKQAQMPWNWSERGPMSVEYGGNVGTRNEANVAHAWNKYELEILDRKLRKHGRETRLQGAEQLVYLDKAAANYKEEADECLKAEFEQWLQGMHIDNRYPEQYDNSVPDGRPERKRIQATENPDEYVGSRLDGWTPTWWGKAALTHLPGVREYLREQKIRATEHELDMNLLAEFGPQNLEQAWQYFKHWVKKRPLTEAPCPEAFAVDKGFPGQLNPVKRSNFGNMPHHFGPDRINGFGKRPPTGGKRPPTGDAPSSTGGGYDGAPYVPFGTDVSGMYGYGGGGDPSNSGGGGDPSNSGGSGGGGGLGSGPPPSSDSGPGPSNLGREAEPEPLAPITRLQKAVAGVGTAGSVVKAMAEEVEFNAYDPLSYRRPTTPPVPEFPSYYGNPGYSFGQFANDAGTVAARLFDGYN